MMQQQLVLFIRLLNMLFCLICIGLFKTISGCYLHEFQNSVQNCWHDEYGSLPTTLEYFPVGTKCMVVTDNAASQIACGDMEWHTFDSPNNNNSVIIYSRQKRNFWDDLFCVLTFFSCLWAKRPGPPPDTESPSIICNHVYAAAKPMQTHGEAWWQEPLAYDSRDGTITPTRFGRGPNSIFYEGTTDIVYQAKDRSGNVASCTTNIHMHVVRCTAPTDIPNGYYMCHPSTDFVYGGSCTFGCYDGFDLHGESELKCNKYGHWTFAQPNCIARKCPPVPSIDGANVSCTNENNFRSICTYSCEAGFSMPPRVSSVIVCSIGKTWRMYGQPKCIDVEPPLLSCPSNQIFGTDTGTNTAVVFWTLPRVSDNFDKNIKPTQKLGPPSESSLIAGTYKIEYGAKDKEGNKAGLCSFNVIVQDVRCPKLYATPNMQLDCPQGYRTGSECNISCDPGTVLDGIDIVPCDRIPEKLYGEWKWKDGVQPLCKRTNVCQALAPPNKGAVVCDNWTGGPFCQFQCMKGTAMAGVDWMRLYVCTTDGDWFPAPILKSCDDIQHGNRSLHVETSFFFSGLCTDSETKAAIARNFINIVQQSVYFEICPDSRECNPQNVQVRCGGTNKLRRDTDEDRLTNIVTISADLPEPITNENASFIELHRSFMSIYTRLEEILMTNASEFFNETLSLRFVKNTGVGIACPEGSVVSEQSLNCVDCPKGAYFRESTKSCEFCDKGTYQNSTAQTFCHGCPFGTTTSDIGSATIDSCEDACEPGFYSSTGIQPCSPCETGYYQSSYAKTSCDKCIGTTTTLKVGTSSIEDCKEFDIVLPLNFEKMIIGEFETTLLMREFIISFWIQYLNSNDSDYLTLTFTDSKGAAHWSCTILMGLNITNSEEWNTTDDGIELKLPDSRWHHVIISSQISSTELYLDKHLILSSSSLVRQTDLNISRFVLKAGEQFSGTISQLHVWSTREIFNITSKCLLDIIGDILSWQKFGEFVLDYAFLQIPSVCDDFNNCISSPCLNGTCIDALDGYECECFSGYTGTDCNLNIDDCTKNVCMEGSTCIDGVNNYKCICPQDMTGQFCDIKMVHGQWSEWTGWTECSQTCGDAEQSRGRLCNSPNPDNGGNNCSGLSDEIRKCNLTVCQTCPNITAPDNGTISCDSENDTIVCNISCIDGFDFDTEPLESYYCGPNTFHIWNFETDVNPSRKLPKCTEITSAEKISVHYSATYRDLFCRNIDVETITKTKVNQTLDDISKTTSCFASGNCRLEKLIISGCNPKERQRREPSRVGFSLTITLLSSNGKIEPPEKLQDVLKKVHGAAETGQFIVNISQTEYDIDLNLTTLSGEVKCPEGTTRVYHYCVPCGRGSFLFLDYCKPCPHGSYQDEIGQMRCKSCRSGRTTLGEGATSESECSVEKVKILTDQVNSIAVALGVTVPILTVFVVILLYKKAKYTCKTVKITSFGLKQASSEGNDGILIENQTYAMNTTPFLFASDHQSTVLTSTFEVT